MIFLNIKEKHFFFISMVIEVLINHQFLCVFLPFPKLVPLVKTEIAGDEH